MLVECRTKNLGRIHRNDDNQNTTIRNHGIVDCGSLLPLWASGSLLPELDVDGSQMTFGGVL